MSMHTAAGHRPNSQTAIQWAAAAAAARSGMWIILRLLHSGDPQLEDLGLTAILGAALGMVFQRTRFCMLCMLRDALTARNFLPILGLLLAIAVGSAGYLVIFGAWIPDPSAGYLPPNAFIGPIGIHLLVGGLVFGLGMALSGSCISSHMYRGAEGTSVSWIALAAVVPGFVLGYLHWDFWYLNSIQSGPVVWLPQQFGYSGAALLQFGGIAALALVLLHFHRSPVRSWVRREPSGVLPRLRLLLCGRWPVAAGAAAIGGIGAIAYFRLRPLGVTSELSRYSRLAGRELGVLQSDRFPGLDAIAGCTPQEAMAILSQNGVLVLALIGGSLVAALAAGSFRLRPVSGGEAGRALAGGVMLGYGAMISLGCSIGTFLSGTMAFSLSGWVFGAAMVVGVIGGLSLLKRFTVSAGCTVPSAPAVQGDSVYAEAGESRAAEIAGSGYIISAELADKLWSSGVQGIAAERDDLLVIDCGRTREEYAAGHIPGAVWMDFARVYRPQKGRSGMFAPPAVGRSASHYPHELIVVYDQADGQRASRAAVGLQLAGYPNILVLDGGLSAWVAAGTPLESGMGQAWEPRGHGAAAAGVRLDAVSGTWLAEHRGECVVVDTRRADEYTGTERRARRGGHIPGAIHWEWRQALRTAGLGIRPVHELRAAFFPLVTEACAAAGHAYHGKTVVFYCQSGVRASHTAWLFSRLYPRIPAAIYDGSWEEWGNEARFPVVDGETPHR